MSRVLALALAMLAAAPALAQQPPPDPVEANLLQQWQARVTMDGNVVAAIEKVLAAWRESRAEVERLREKCGEPCKAKKPDADG